MSDGVGEMRQGTHHHSADKSLSSVDEGPRVLSNDGRDSKSKGDKERDFHNARMKRRKRVRGVRGRKTRNDRTKAGIWEVEKIGESTCCFPTAFSWNWPVILPRLGLVRMSAARQCSPCVAYRRSRYKEESCRSSIN